MSEDESSRAAEQPESTAEDKVGERFDDVADAELFEDISPHPPGDQVDRSIIVGEAVKALSLWAVRLLIIAAFLYALGQIVGHFWRGILPVLLALIICTVLAPTASWLRARALPPALAAIVTILFFFGLVGSLFAIVAPSFARQSQSLYLQTVEGIQRLQLWAQGPPLELDSEEMGTYIDELAAWLQARAGAIAGSVFTGIGAATTVVVTLLIVLVLVFFFLKDGHKFLPWLRDATGRRAGWHLTEVLTRGWETLGGFIRAQALVSLVDAVFIGVGLAIIGVPLAMTLAIITFIAGFIPFVGAIVAGALAVTIALVSLGITQALIVLGLVLVVQQLEGNVLSPWLQSRAMNLHPVVVLISVTVGSTLFGLVGAFLAVPTAAMLAVVYRYVKDITMLQSGEKEAEDIKFATVAGHLVGKYNQAQGERRRALWRQAPDHVDMDSAVADAHDAGTSHGEANLDMDAAPTHHGAYTPPLRVPHRKDIFDKVFGWLPRR